MADQQQQQSNHKRHDSEESTANKRRSSNDDEPSLDTNEEKKTATITTIYYDCLERIFDFLDLESLLNVAGTCKRLQIAAAAKFSDDFGKCSVLISVHGFYQRLYVVDNSIRVRGLKFCLPFLRCFGAKISNIQISFEFANNPLYLQRRRYLDEYISEYCADTLASILFAGESEYSMSNFSKPFKNVERLDISSHRFKEQFDIIVNMFPNLRQLGICFFDWLGIGNYLIPTNHLPLVKHLHISMEHPTNRIVNFLAANHQLQIVEFQLFSNFSFSKLLDMIIGNSSILTLVAHAGRTTVNIDDLLRLAREHPVLVKLDLGKSGMVTADAAITFIRQLNALKMFRFRVEDRCQYIRLLNQLDGDWQHEFQEYAQNLFIITLYR